MKSKTFGQSLIESMKEGLEALRSGKELRTTLHLELPQAPAIMGKQVQSIRTELGLTQKQFSGLIMVSPKTVQSWEQGIRVPSGAALRVMQILKDPSMLDPILKFRSSAGKGKLRPNRRTSI